MTRDDELSSTHFWAAVLVPTKFVTVDNRGDSVFSTPVNFISAPLVIRGVVVRVTVVTPCCRHPLAGIPVLIGGRKAGTTNNEGIATFRLFPGTHEMSVPSCSTSKRTINIEGCPSPLGLDIAVAADGTLFLFLIDNSIGDDIRDGVMLTCNSAEIPDEARAFVGHATLPNGRSAQLPVANMERFSRVIRVPEGSRCDSCLPRLEVHNSDGREYRPNMDLTWFDDFMNECQVAIFFSASPIRLGDLVGDAPHVPSPGQFAPANSVPPVEQVPETASTSRVVPSQSRGTHLPAASRVATWRLRMGPRMSPSPPRPNSSGGAVYPPRREGSRPNRSIGPGGGGGGSNSTAARLPRSSAGRRRSRSWSQVHGSASDLTIQLGESFSRVTTTQHR